MEGSSAPWEAHAGSQSDGLGCVDVDVRPGRLSEAPWRLPEGRAEGRGGGSGGSLEAWEALGVSQAGGKLEAGRLEAGWRGWCAGWRH